MIGIATMGNDVCLGLGTDVVSARMVEGRFPNISQVIPKKRPLFTFRVDPKLLAETLLAIADLLPEEARSVQFFYYGEDLPLGFCARNIDNGIMIDALVVPLTATKPDTKDKPAEGAAPQEAEPTNGRRRKKADTPEAPEQPDAATAEPQEPTGQDAPPAADVAAQDSQQPKGKKSKKAKA
jgi:hypothetical protein